MALTQENRKELLNMILRRTATGTMLGMGFASALLLLKQRKLAAIALGYSIGYYLQDANQILVKEIKA
jgi:hypothetical protein